MVGMRLNRLTLVFLACGALGCGGEALRANRWQRAALSAQEASALVADNFRLAAAQYDHLLSRIAFKDGLPRSLGADGSLRLVPPSDWTSGFFPGALWYLYEFTRDEKWQALARRYTGQLEMQQWNKGTHDTGFMMYCSYGNAYRLTGDAHDLPILLQTARSLSSRFLTTVGCLRSWDWGPWKYPVIIDNMMNLELLYFAARQGAERMFADLANSHARRTDQNHFREDGSSFHVVDYHPQDGAVLSRGTHQGYADSSAWARGQAWGLYGFTMAFRETGDPAYLQRARKAADFILGNPHLPEDLVPYWDHDAPGLPDAPRDASAAAITCSALYELGALLGADGVSYLDAADRLLMSLSGPDYRASAGENGGFILKHCVGNWPEHSEIDVPLSYADYYFLEANLRRLRLGQQAFAVGSGSLF